MSSPPADSSSRLSSSALRDVKKVGSYYLTKTLGQGAFSKVKLGIHETTEQQVAIKIMKKSLLMQQHLVEQVKREISIMKLIDHPNVVKLYEVMSSADNLYLVMELVTGGELFWRVATERVLSDDAARKYFHELIGGLEYCHAHGVFHRDLKLENLLVDNEGKLKISDFGLSTKVRTVDDSAGALSPSQRRTAEATLLKTRCGTPQYAAPEIIGTNGYFGAAVDIWACGVILYIFLCGQLPFDEANESDLFRKITKAQVSYPNSLSDEAKDLLKKIFTVDPTKRITIKQIKEHSWFIKGYDPNSTPLLDISNIDDAEPFTIVGSPELHERKISSMNAFDLINKAGMLNLTRLIRHTKTQVAKAPSYFTTHCEPQVIMFRIRTILDSMPYMGYKWDAAAVQLHVTGKYKTKGFILFNVIVSRVTDEVRLVDFERQSGSILEFWRIFMFIRQECADVITSTSPRKSSP